MRTLFLILVLFTQALIVLLAQFWPMVWWAELVAIPVSILGLHDMYQDRHAILRNFPVLGHFRYAFEAIRPEIQQYFIERQTDGRPFSREQRSVVYQRAKKEIDTVPFGTQLAVYGDSYEWMAHSIAPIKAPEHPPRITLGNSQCKQPYASSLLNISAMSYGSLSTHAVLALNGGAKQGGFAHNTGEGGISPYHLKPGGDLIWQIGTGYFGCRAADGGFDLEKYTANASRPSVKVIELKLSQGAKPGHGGILPAKKVTKEISEIRGVPMGQDVNSPPAHLAFSTPTGLLEFIQVLRDGSGGKPVGFKLCIGAPSEFAGICMAMVKTGIIPDFITIDGGEGGTGAAPIEFSNAMGMPLLDGLSCAHNMLVGFGLRDQLKIIASGKVVTGFDMAVRLAAGADMCNSARGMMFALGCIQALRCNNNDCPAGVATQKAHLVEGLVVEDKVPRVANYHHGTVHSLMELLGAAGIAHPDDLRPHHIHRRVSPVQVRTYADIYTYIQPGCLLEAPYPPEYEVILERASAEKF